MSWTIGIATSQPPVLFSTARKKDHVNIIYSFYKFKLMSSFKIITVVFVRICRYSIQ